MHSKLFFFIASICFLSIPSVNAVAEEELDELIVVGSHLDLQPEELGSAMTILSAEDIANIGAPFVADVLRHVPGLAVSRTGPAGGLTQVRIRGSEANHVLVLIDGLEANPANGEYDFSNLITANIERIEVLRGAQSGLYGSNATAGVINIVTRPATEATTVDLQVESGNLDFNRQALGISGGNEDAQGSLSLNHQRIAFNAAETGSETDLNEQYTAYVKGNWRIADTLKAFASGHYNQRQFDADAQIDGVAVDSDDSGDNKDRGYLLGVQLTALDNTWINKLQYDNSRFENGGVNSFGRFGSGGRREKTSWQSRLDFDNRGSVRQRATLVVENERETYRNTEPSDPSQIPEQSRRLRSAGLEYFADFDRQFYVTAAYRADNNDDFADASTYQVTSRWMATKSTAFHASVGTGITNPSFFEQFGFIPGFYTGNPDLEPEEQFSWDIGWQQHWLDGDLTTDITYFDLTLEKEIAGFSTPINLTTDSERRGLEVSLAWQLANGFALNGSYTHTDTEELGQEEVRRPEKMASLDLSVPLFKQKWRWQLGVVYNGEMIDTDFSTFTRRSVDAYTLVNTSLRYFFNDKLEAFARINNALDEDYQEVIGYATPGTYGSAGISVRF